MIANHMDEHRLKDLHWAVFIALWVVLALVFLMNVGIWVTIHDRFIRWVGWVINLFMFGIVVFLPVARFG